MKKAFYAIFLALLVPVLLSAQTIVKVASDAGSNEGNLNLAVQAATTAGTLSSTTFQLEPNGYYVLTGAINVPAGQTLTIVAPAPGTTQATAPPQIVYTSAGGVTNQFIFDCFGDIVLKNIWVRYANTTGAQVGTTICLEENSAAPNGRHATFEGVMFEYTPSIQNLASGAVTINCNKFRGSFKNCYFKNCIDAHLRYYGRALSFPFNTTGLHADSVSFENTTFANMGYVYMQEGGEYTDVVKFNNCSFLNVVMFPLESGWWKSLAVTNCLFQNCFMFGNIPSQTGTGDPNGGTFRVDSTTTFGFTVPFTEQDRHILFTNSSYFLERWLIDWMRYNPYSVDQHKQRLDDNIPVPMPMLSPGTRRFFDSTDATGKKGFPFMNIAKLDSSSNPGFLVAPTDSAKAKIYMWRKWNDNTDTNWAYRPDDGFNAVWPLTENMAYTNPTLKALGMGGFPIGDLYHWWPTQYTAWSAQANAEKTAIENSLATGKLTAVTQQLGATVPADFSLEQNYPNPFNPTTHIKFAVPVSGPVSLKVYNLLGEEVATIFSGFQQAGRYVADFDGSQLSSGVYIYRLQAGQTTIAKKLMLMK
jgi:hypothetical protein